MGIEFGIEKYDRLIMKRGKRELIEVMELPNQESIKTLNVKDNFKYLVILERASSNKQKWAANKKRVAQIKLSEPNLATEISSKEISWAVTLVKYSGSFIK